MAAYFLFTCFSHKKENGKIFIGKKKIFVDGGTISLWTCTYLRHEKRLGIHTLLP